MSSEWDQRVVLVTGASSGLGRACAVEFGRVGASAVVIADVDEEGGEETARLVANTGSASRFVATDVTDDDAVAAAVTACVDEFGRLDAAVNNAGTTGVGGNVADYPPEEWDRVLGLNLTGVFSCLRHEIPVMVDAGGGAIVNMASGAGLLGFPGLPAYVASKHGVVGLTKAAALEYVGSGVRINAVCPGSVRTPMLEAYMAGDEQVEQMLTMAVPMGRLGTPEEIAGATVWLCSDAASYVVGHAFPVDGGTSVW